MTGEAESLGSDFLGLLIKTNNDPNDEKIISVQDVIDECKTQYVVGKETTNGLLVWAILLLSINTDWQGKQEQRSSNFVAWIIRIQMALQG